MVWVGGTLSIKAYLLKGVVKNNKAIYSNSLLVLIVLQSRLGRVSDSLNEAIKRERHHIPTPADVQSQFSGKTIFTVADMKDGYWHVLSDESSYYCKFNTPRGRNRFLRMPFSISSASEVMQKHNEETFGDISGVHVIADDLIIAVATKQEHDAILRKVLD